MSIKLHDFLHNWILFSREIVTWQKKAVNGSRWLWRQHERHFFCYFRFCMTISIIDSRYSFYCYHCAAALLFASSHICENISDNIRNGWEGLSNKLVSQSERKNVRRWKRSEVNEWKWKRNSFLPFVVQAFPSVFIDRSFVVLGKKAEKKTNDVDLSSGVFSCSTKVFIYTTLGWGCLAMGIK